MNSNYSHKRKNEQGIVAITLVFSLVFIAMILSLSSVAVFANRLQATQNFGNSEQAYYAAESGLEDAIYRIKNAMNVPANYTLSVGGSSADITVDSPTSSERIITVNGNVKNIFRKLETRLTLTNIIPDFFYGMQVGEGGVKILGENVRVIGNMFSNGNIIGESGFNITGSVIVANGTEASPNQQWIVQNSDFLFGLEVAGNKQFDAAQSFSPSKDGVLNKITLYIKKVGTPPDLSIIVAKDKNGEPDRKVVDGVLQASLVTDQYGWVDVVFSRAKNIDDDKTYWIVANASDDSDNYWVWGYDNTDVYPDGEGKYSEKWDKKPWFDIGGDLNFQVWFGGIATFIDNATVGIDVLANTITDVTVGRDAYGKTISDVIISRDVFTDTLSDCTVTGDASYNTISNCTVGGTSTTPTTPPDDPAPGTWPISDGNIATWKAEADAGTLISSSFVIPAGQTRTLGPAKITGNMELNDNSTLIVTGTIWVEGKIDVKKNATVILDEGYGSDSGVIISDGIMHFGDEADLTGSSDPNSFIIFIVLATGGGHHGLSVDFHKNLNVDAVVFVPNGGVHLHQNVHVTQLTADYIEIDQDSVVEYDEGLVNLNFSSGPGAGWQIISWKEVE